MPNDSKTVLRKKFLSLLRAQSDADRLKKSRQILQKLFSRQEFHGAKTVLFYASFDGEVETFDMIKQAQKLGKSTALPAIIKDQKKIVPTVVQNVEEELAIGAYGIKEHSQPLEKSLATDKIDLVVVPGLAFDRDNYRLGRGHGYYDRFLTSLSPRTPAIGLAFDFQIVDRLPHLEDHDHPVSCVIVN